MCMMLSCVKVLLRARHTRAIRPKASRSVALALTAQRAAVFPIVAERKLGGFEAGYGNDFESRAVFSDEARIAHL